MVSGTKYHNKKQIKNGPKGLFLFTKISYPQLLVAFGFCSVYNTNITRTNMATLTKKQSEVYEFIKKFVSSEGYAPSYREIAEYFELSSPATAHQHVKALIEKGFLESGDNGIARSIEIIEPEERFNSKVAILPLSGLITAGAPIEALETNDMIAVPSDFVTDQLNSYVLKVKGNSMIEDGILSGDYVVVERNNYPKNGDVVVALLDNTHATLKRFYKETNRIRLQPANRTMQPIYVKDVIVQGVVRAVIRRFNTI